MAVHDYFGITITLAGGTATNLLTALRAVDSSVPATAREVTVQNDISSPAALLIGDPSVATSALRCGTQLGIGAAKTYRSSSVQDVPIGRLYLRSTGAAVVNVEGWC